LAEVLVVLVLLLLVGLMVLTALPRQQEAARLAACRGNLARIGIAVALYDTAQGHLPAVTTTGPLDSLRQGLGLDDFDALRDPKTAPRPVGSPPSPHRLAGFLCLSDRVAVRSTFAAPTSYRACAGDDPAGQTGPFPLGGRTSRAAVEAADGLAYTAAFSERLVGTGQDQIDPARNYFLTPGPVGPEGCPAAAGRSWRGDAGSHWGQPDWTSSLYNHAIVPGAVPSCIAADGRTARIGASSTHPGGVHLLRMDLSVGLVTPQIDPGVWRRLATVGEAPPAP
jgi:type II secretory pathway pseudopilin PulG